MPGDLPGLFLGRATRKIIEKPKQVFFTISKLSMEAYVKVFSVPLFSLDIYSKIWYRIFVSASQEKNIYRK
jgi:hypothetical protein